MYGSGPDKVATTVTDFNRAEALKNGEDSFDVFTEYDAREAIKDYFDTYKTLAAWLKSCKREIETNGYIYSILGRKRRLRNVFSTDRGIAAAEVRSGINFLVQSVASDVNLLAAMDMQDYIEATGIDAKIFGLVHDSILAEVKIEDLEDYRTKLAYFTQLDRGMSIPGAPISIDQEVGDDYSFGGFVKDYPELADVA